MPDETENPDQITDVPEDFGSAVISSFTIQKTVYNFILNSITLNLCSEIEEEVFCKIYPEDDPTNVLAICMIDENKIIPNELILYKFKNYVVSFYNQFNQPVEVEIKLKENSSYDFTLDFVPYSLGSIKYKFYKDETMNKLLHEEMTATLNNNDRLRFNNFDFVANQLQDFSEIKNDLEKNTALIDKDLVLNFGTAILDTLNQSASRVNVSSFTFTFDEPRFLNYIKIMDPAAKYSSFSAELLLNGSKISDISSATKTLKVNKMLDAGTYTVRFKSIIQITQNEHNDVWESKLVTSANILGTNDNGIIAPYITLESRKIKNITYRGVIFYEA